MKKKKKGLLLLLLVLSQIFASTPLEAASGHYIVDDGQRIYTPDSYTLKAVFESFIKPDGSRDYLKQPEDLFINKQGYIFIADTGNNRIVKVDGEGNLLAVFTGPEDKPFNSPRGVFADENGNMYIADTNNLRIVHLDSNGQYIEEFTKPDSELLGENFIFDPTKIALSKTGYIYILKGEGILTIDAYNNFRGYMGQTAIPFNFIEVLLRIVASDSQKTVIRKRLASAYTNIHIDDEGYVYATSLDKIEGELKKINSVGENIYRKYTSVNSNPNIFDELFSNTLNLENKSFKYGEAYNNSSPKFIDITVDKNGIVTAIEANSGKLYQYDQNGNNLTVFGGKGSSKGMFTLPASLAVSSEGTIYVLDSGLGNIQSFEPTRFISLVHDATTLYSSGRYDEAHMIWKEVLKIDSRYQMAVMGIANSLFKQEKWKEAMSYYLLADDRASYSKAFDEYRYEVFRKWFVVIMPAAIFTVFLLILSINALKKTSKKTLDALYAILPKKMGIIQQLKISFGVLFNPRETFEQIKYSRGRLNIVSATIVYALIFITRVFYLTTAHYPLQTISIKDTNIALEFVKMLVPPLTWVVSSYFVSSIIEGESRLDEIYTATSICFIPYIIVYIPFTILTNILSRAEKPLLDFVNNFVIIWILLLIFYSFKVLNDYKTGKGIGGYVLSGVTVLIIWIICVLGYVSTGSIIQFATGIIREVQMLLL